MKEIFTCTLISSPFPLLNQVLPTFEAQHWPFLSPMSQEQLLSMPNYKMKYIFHSFRYIYLYTYIYVWNIPGTKSKKDDPTTPCQYDILFSTAALSYIPSFLTQPGGMSHSINHGSIHLTMWWPQNICQVFTQFRAVSSSCLGGHLVIVTTTLIWQIV